jgi:hypothetical protein
MRRTKRVIAIAVVAAGVVLWGAHGAGFACGENFYGYYGYIFYFNPGCGLIFDYYAPFEVGGACPEFTAEDQDLLNILQYQFGNFYGWTVGMPAICPDPCFDTFYICDFAPDGCPRMEVQPFNPSPPHTATQVSENPVLTWDAAPEAFSYEVYFGTSSAPPVVATVFEESYSPGTLQLGTQYYWKIRPISPCGATNMGPLWYFRTRFLGSTILLPDLELVTWTIEGGGPADVIRGDLANVNETATTIWLGAVTCLADNSTAGELTDTSTPPPGQTYFYLARPNGGSYGADSGGKNRIPNSGGCL